MTPDLPSAPEQVGDRQAHWYLNDEREFLQRSLHDADREHAAGDLSDDDHRVLVARDRTRLAEVEAELTAMGPVALDVEPPEPPLTSRGIGRSEWRRIGIIACCFLIVAGAVILVAHAVHSRLPGETLTGGVSGAQAQQIAVQLAEAQVFNNKQDDVAALKLYNQVLSEDPNNPNALAEAGWLQWKSGFAAHVDSLIRTGRAEVGQAITASPSDYLGHLFLGIIMVDQDDNAKGAVVQFDEFLADEPPPVAVDSVATLMAGVYTSAGVAVPPVVAAAAKATASSTTTTTTTSTP